MDFFDMKFTYSSIAVLISLICLFVWVLNFLWDIQMIGSNINTKELAKEVEKHDKLREEIRKNDIRKLKRILPWSDLEIRKILDETFFADITNLQVDGEKYRLQWGRGKNADYGYFTLKERQIDIVSAHGVIFK